MTCHNQYLKRFLEYISSIVSLLKFCINIEILLVTSFLMGAISLISVTYANQHEEFEFQFNVEAFEREMLLEADDEITFDINGNITATGNVQIRYDLYTLRADSVYFDREDSKVVAENNVRILDRNGNIIIADKIELTEDFKNGIFHALNIETIQRILVRSQEAERKDGKLTTLKDGLYSPYLSQPEDFPPPWRISATEIILDHEADTVSFIAPRVEIFGLPLGVLPNFTVADPLLPRYTGFLGPTLISDTKLGYGVRIPYYIDLKPNLDMTVSAAPLTNQGLLMSGEFRHQLEKGIYTIRGSGISQLNPDIFVTSDEFKEVGNRQYRGAINFNGGFGINRRWSWGWDLNAYSDKKFVPDYGSATLGGFGSQQHIRLNGNSGRNNFEAHMYKFEVFGDHPKNRVRHENIEPQKPLTNCQPSCEVKDPGEKQAKVHPLIDYQYFLKNSIFGGELSFGSNVISVSRTKSDYFHFKGDKFYRGIEGAISRSTVFMNWKRNIYTTYGHVFTPFLNFQGDFFVLRNLDTEVDNLTSDNIVVRGLPTTGFKYSFPLIDTYFWGSQIIEPIMQLIVRPDEKEIGKLPNEDAQSLVFDASTLFETNKFSGFDRTEGGIRANLGIKQLLQFNNGGSISSLIGQSFHLLGENSYLTKQDDNSNLVKTSDYSGLDSKISDYVGSIYLDSAIGLRVGANARVDYEEFKINRFEVESAGLLGPISASLNYAFLKGHPNQENDDDEVKDRQEIIGASNVRIFDKFRIFGSTRFDLENKNFIKNVAGFGYDDEGFTFSLTFSEDRTRLEGKAENRRLWFRFGFRTLGDTGFSLAIDPETD